MNKKNNRILKIVSISYLIANFFFGFLAWNVLTTNINIPSESMMEYKSNNLSLPFLFNYSTGKDSVLFKETNLFAEKSLEIKEKFKSNNPNILIFTKHSTFIDRYYSMDIKSLHSAEPPLKETYSGVIINKDNGMPVSYVKIKIVMNYFVKYYGGDRSPTYQKSKTTQSNENGEFSVEFTLNTGYNWREYFESWGTPIILSQFWKIDSITYELNRHINVMEDMDRIYPHLIFRPSDFQTIKSRITSGEDAYNELWKRITANNNQGANDNLSNYNSGSWAHEYSRANIAKNAAFIYSMTGNSKLGDKAWEALKTMKYQTIYNDIWGNIEKILEDDFQKNNGQEFQDLCLKASDALIAYLQAADLLIGYRYLEKNPSGIPEWNDNIRYRIYNLANTLYNIGIVFGDPNGITFYKYSGLIKVTVGPGPFLKNNYALKLYSSVGMYLLFLPEIINELPYGNKDQYFNWLYSQFWYVFEHYLTNSEGGYSEGPSYLLYSAVSYLTFMRAYNIAVKGQDYQYYIYFGDQPIIGPIIIPNLLTSDRVSQVHDWGVKIRMPDGIRPGFDDSYYKPFIMGMLATSGDTVGSATDCIDFQHKTQYAWDWYNQDPLPQTKSPKYFSKECMDVSVDLFCTFSSNIPQVEPKLTPTQFLPEAGMAVFRSDWGKDANYMLLLGENGKMNVHNYKIKAVAKDIVFGITWKEWEAAIESHEHPDPASFVIYAHGELLALDSGYASYGNRSKTCEPKNHNIILLDNHGSNNNEGNSYDAFISNYFNTDYLDYSEVHYTNPNADVCQRSVLFPENEFFIVMDRIDPKSSLNGKECKWLLHGNGDFYQELDGARWERPNAELIVKTTSNFPISFSSGEAYHSFEYNSLAKHKFLEAKNTYVVSSPSQNLVYLSILYPQSKSDPTTPTISKLGGSNDVIFKISGISSSEDNVAVIAMNSISGNVDSLTIPREKSGIGTITFKGLASYIQVDNSHQPALIFAKKTSSIDYDGKNYFSTKNGENVDIYFKYERDDEEIKGYIQGDANSYIVNIYTGEKPVGLSGASLNDYSNGITTLTISNKQEFTLYLSKKYQNVQNHGFEYDFLDWNIYGDGTLYETCRCNAPDGNYAVHIKRDDNTSQFFGIYKKSISCEPNTEYKLSVWVKTALTNGQACASFGNWNSDPIKNTHYDFGYISGNTTWQKISGNWISQSWENTLDIVLYGRYATGDFYYDDVEIEVVKPQNLSFENGGLGQWKSYGDGEIYKITKEGIDGQNCAYMKRSIVTQNYFGYRQITIPCKPNTKYKLTVSVNPKLNSGNAVIALGNWDSYDISKNTHKDYYYKGENGKWGTVSGVWESNNNERFFDIYLFGNKDFSGVVWFDNVEVEEIKPNPIKYNY